MVQLGVMNVGLPEFNADMPASMAPSVQLMQQIPFPGTLRLKGDVAEATHRMAEAGADETWWELRNQAADLFYDLYSLDGRIVVMRETLGLLESFRTVARAVYAAGEGAQTDVLRADVEVVRMDGEIRTMEAMRTAAAARLNGLLDRPAGTPVPGPVLDPLPSTIPDTDTMRAWAWEFRPLLRRDRTAVDRAELGTALARKTIWPDFTVGVTYGQRDRGAGTERMGSAVIGFTLPIHAGSRQFAARDEARASLRRATADLSASRAEVSSRIGVLVAELETAGTLIDLYRTGILPEARATVESALSSYRVGGVDFMTLVDAEMSANRYEAELVDLFANYGRAVAGLESTIGRPLPRSASILAPAPEQR
jgi:outer membrane protein TolC